LRKEQRYFHHRAVTISAVTYITSIEDFYYDIQGECNSKDELFV